MRFIVGFNVGTPKFFQKTYDPEADATITGTSLALVLTAQDRALISSMAPDATIYCVYPTDPGPDREAIGRWLEELKTSVE